MRIKENIKKEFFDRILDEAVMEEDDKRLFRTNSVTCDTNLDITNAGFRCILTVNTRDHSMTILFLSEEDFSFFLITHKYKFFVSVCMP